MVTKILFTLAVIGAVLWAVRFRRRSPGPSPANPAHQGRTIKMVAVLVLAIMGSGALLVGYLRWRHDHQVLEVRVVDAGSGRITRYRVYRNRMGAHGFETVDGRRVRLAETERMEVSPAP